MSAALDPESGIVFESVGFHDHLVEISFTEPHDRGDGVVRIQTVVYDVARLPQEHADFLVALTAVVDAGRLAIRNPPEEMHRG